ncbi:MAG: peptidylprolyl isomerase [Jatrophihabitans sp.]
MGTEKQRREAERRRRQRQTQRRSQQQQHRKRTNLIISILGTLTVIGLVIGLLVLTDGSGQPDPQAGGSTLPTSSATTVPTSSATTVPTAVSGGSSAPRTPTYPCTWTKTGTPVKKAVAPSTTKPARSGTVSLSVTTTQGSMQLSLDRSLAPCTVASFVSLVNQGYYNATPCHRLTTAGIFVLQCGDPSGTGTGDPGYSIPDEATGRETYPAGTIAMARSNGPHSGGSQFFIVYKDSPNLQQGLGQRQYTVFGKVADGLGVVSKVAAGGADTGTDGKPNIPLVISRISVPR